MDKLIVLGALGAGFYVLHQQQQQQQQNQEGIHQDASGQVDITSAGTNVFQKIDRTFAYTLLLKAHSDVTDFDNLTDADLEQLLRAINIDPDVLKTHMTQEQADFLIHSAEQAVRLRVDITIDQETKKQNNAVIRAHKKQEVDRWTVERQSEIDSRYAEDPYTDFYNINWSSAIVHLGFLPIVDLNGFLNIIPEKFRHDTYIVSWATRNIRENNGYLMLIVGHLPELNDQLKGLNTTNRQQAIDLLATETASKKAIIDSTDYVALGYSVDQDGDIIEPQ